MINSQVPFHEDCEGELQQDVHQASGRPAECGGLCQRPEIEGYGAVVEEVDTGGFTVRCGTYRMPLYHIYDMDISWTSWALI